jgi:hypothetical protein
MTIFVQQRNILLYIIIDIDISLKLNPKKSSVPAGWIRQTGWLEIQLSLQSV